MTQSRAYGWARKFQARRSPRAVREDAKRRAKVTFPENLSVDDYRRWKRSPGRYDIAGIDTPAETPEPAKPKKARRPRKIRTGRGKMEYSQSWYDKLPWKSDPMTAYRMATEAAMVEGIDDVSEMRAYLEDSDWEGDWDHDDRSVAINYRRAMWRQMRDDELYGSYSSKTSRIRRRGGGRRDDSHLPLYVRPPWTGAEHSLAHRGDLRVPHKPQQGWESDENVQRNQWNGGLRMTLWNVYLPHGNFAERMAVEAPNEREALEVVAEKLRGTVFVIDYDGWDARFHDYIADGYSADEAESILDETYLPVDGGYYLDITGVTIDEARDTGSDGRVDAVKLAYDLADFGEETDHYEFWDNYDTMEDAVTRLTQSLGTLAGSRAIRDDIAERMAEGFATYDEDEKARGLISRLDRHIRSFGSGSGRPKAKKAVSKASKPKAKTPARKASRPKAKGRC